MVPPLLPPLPLPLRLLLLCASDDPAFLGGVDDDVVLSRPPPPLLLLLSGSATPPSDAPLPPPYPTLTLEEEEELDGFLSPPPPEELLECLEDDEETPTGGVPPPSRPPDEDGLPDLEAGAAVLPVATRAPELAEGSRPAVAVPEDEAISLALRGFWAARWNSDRRSRRFETCFHARFNEHSIRLISGKSDRYRGRGRGGAQRG